MKKGFTLIELLAVIVILAIISLIAIPIVMDIINDSKKEAAKRSVDGYVRAINYKIADLMLHNEEEIDGDYVIGENALELDGNNLTGIAGGYTINNNRVLWAGLCVDGYSIEYNAVTNNTEINNAGNYCNIVEPYEFEEPVAELMSAACTDSNKYTEEEIFKIYTVEDLVCLSNLSNSGKNFNGKTIHLLRDINLSDSDSYNDSATTIYGDINGDGVTEGLLTELTTGRGFKPIGNSSTPFKGIFVGNAKTISNLMINRTTAYNGLFGYNQGTIKGITIRNASITSGKESTNYSYAGILVGYNLGNISSIDIQGNITASGWYVGGITGYTNKDSNASVSIKSLLFKGNVTGYAYVGGLSGIATAYYTTTMESSGVVYDSTVKATTQDTSTVWGIHYGYSGYLNNNTKYKNVTVIRANNITVQNYDKPVNGLTLEAVDGALDTYIGGDNDSDGYYFDYDSSGNLKLYSLLERPLNYDDNTRKLKDLKGEGTIESPYLITTALDWKLASSTVKEAKYYSLETDIDFSTNKFYALGTSSNKFKGNINGNMHQLSNITIYGRDYSGMFGYNTGTIEGLRINDLTIDSTGTYVGMVGHNTGTIKGIEIRNATVTPGKDSSNYSYAGILVGYNLGNISSIDIKGNITASGWYVGGITGYTNKDSNASVSIKSLLFKGNVTGYAYVGGLSGIATAYYTTTMESSGVVYDSTVKATTQDTSTVWGIYYGYSGSLNNNTKYKNVTVIRANNITVQNYEAAVSDLALSTINGALDTTIGGDNDSDGYYFGMCDGELKLFSKTLNPFDETECPAIASS